MQLIHGEPVTSLAEYRRRGGLEGWERAMQGSPQELIDVISAAGLRGRGGAGFPTAVKWQGVHDAQANRKFVVCNAAEGEPGTFKDRALIRHNPYAVIEGLAIAARAVGAERAYIGTKRCFTREVEGLQRALDEFARETSVADNIEELVLGPDLYAFGEERGLLAVIEGGLPMPRVLPPYLHGLFAGAVGGAGEADSNPTVVDNAETLAHATSILVYGADAFRAVGTDTTPGTTIFTISGDVKHPTVVELPYGLTVRQLVTTHGGGALHGHVKAVLAGAASEVMTAHLLDRPIDFDSMRVAGLAPGSGGFIVYDDTACMVRVAQVFAQFIHHESCGQCTSCKLQSEAVADGLTDVLDGRASGGDVEQIYRMAEASTAGRRCALPVAQQTLVCSIIERFEDDFVAHAEQRCSLRHDMPLPKIVDYTPAGGFVYDTDYLATLPEWDLPSTRPVNVA